jgi:hypothetical protein
VEQGDGVGSRVKRGEFLVAIVAALHALACGQDAPSPGTGQTPGPSGGASGQGGSSEGNAGATPSGGANATGATTSGGNGGRASGGASAARGGGPSGGSATGGSGAVGTWKFDCGDPSLPEATGARAGSADFSANSETGAAESHVLYLNGYFLIRRTRQYVTEGGADHQHEILLTDEQIDALILGNSVVVETNGPPLNASSGHGHTITIRSCFIV